MSRSPSLDARQPLGRSTLKISPICLGTAGFGLTGSRGTEIAAAERVFDAYIDQGGNFIDAAGAGGAAEQFVGRAACGKRDELVIATKYRATIPRDGGNHRSLLRRSVEDSLRRLATDRIDLLYLQTWGGALSPEEAMQGLDDIVRSGKVRHVAIANAPGWRIAEMQILGGLRGWPPLVALQAEYSLVQRSLEHELGPIATALDLGIVAWSPLAAGLLAGTYRRDIAESAPAAEHLPELHILAGDSLTDRTFAVVDAVDDTAAECGATSAQVALAWTMLNPAIAAPIINVRTLEELDEQLGALDLSLSRRQQARLEAISATAVPFPQAVLARPMIVHRILDGLRHDARASRTAATGGTSSPHFP